MPNSTKRRMSSTPQFHLLCSSTIGRYKFDILFSSLFFFFQAEDGIRDHCVTGVQTCALPISARPLFAAAGIARAVRFKSSSSTSRNFSPTAPPARSSPAPLPTNAFAAPRRPARSEERRVGKECRSRWSADDDKKKGRGRERR